MRKWKGKKRHGLAPLFFTLVFILIVFGILLATVVIMGLVSYALIRSGIWVISSPDTPNLPVFLLIFGLSGVGVGTVLAVTVGRLPLRPVVSLLNGMKRLAEGDYEVRIPEGKKRLGRELSRSFNVLAEELQNTEMLRSDFVNSFSHEFKTPIVSIQGFAQLLNRGGLTEEQTREYLGIIEEESRRLAAMATNVLNYNRIENQKILTGVTRFNLSEQIRTCVLMLEKKWTEKKLELSLEFQEHEISANEEMLKQIWINLLDNAVKFTPEGGAVEVTLRETAEKILVVVRNSGTEISLEERKRIFQKFYQSDSTHTKEGTGLGLTIAKRIAELHGGSISVDSGSGWTAFTVELPLTGEASSAIL